MWVEGMYVNSDNYLYTITNYTNDIAGLYRKLFDQILIHRIDKDDYLTYYPPVIFVLLIFIVYH